MKIGEFARKHDASNSTVRFYIDMGLLTPKKNGAQFVFSETDDFEMQTIKELKRLGCTLKESQKYISTMRLYRLNDSSVNEKLLALLEEKETALLQERKQINRNLKGIREKIAVFQNAACDCKGISKEVSAAVPLEFVSMLKCPKCGCSLKLDQASIINNGIESALLSCGCGYQAEIKAGMLYAGDLYDHEKDPDFLKCFFGDYSSASVYDDIFFESSAFNSPELMIAHHKGLLKVKDQLSQFENSRPIIIVPDISCHLLYKLLDVPQLKNAYIIVPTFSPAAIKPILRHISGLSLNVLYIVNQDGVLPLSHHIVDFIIDYSGILNYSFFNKVHFLDLFEPYLKSAAEIYACTECYANNSKSLSNINSSYKFSLPSNMSWNTIKKALSRCDFEIAEKETLGEYKNPGLFWEYHYDGDIRSMVYYHAKRKGCF